MRFLILVFVILLSSTTAYAKNISKLELVKLIVSGEVGYVQAQLDLGELYRKGYILLDPDIPTGIQAVSADYEKAIMWYSKAAQKNNSDAELALAEISTYEQFRSKDWMKGMQWYIKAAEHGNAKAQYALGEIYSSGPAENTLENNRKIIDQNKAFSWFLKSAEQGYAPAQTSVMMAYQLGGRGVKQNDMQALEWTKKAADSGEAYAQHRLGTMYMEGNILPKDFIEAYKWLDISSRSPDRAKTRDKLAKEMTPEQIEASKALAEQWKTSHLH